MDAGYICCYWRVLDLLSRQSKEVYVCVCGCVHVLSHICVLIYKYFYMLSSIFVLVKHEFILVYSTLIPYHMGHSRLLYLLVYKLLLQQWKTCLLLSIPIYLIFSSRIHVQQCKNCWPIPLQETSLSNRIQCSCTMAFPFSLIDFSHFQSCIRHHIFPHLLHWGCFTHL